MGVAAQRTVLLGLPAEKAAGREPALSEREIQVMVLVIQRNSNKRIAERLTISVSTVRHHLRSIYIKLCITKRGQLESLIG